MNVVSLAQGIIKKQQESSWKDDPFDLGIGLNLKNNTSNKERLYDYAQQLAYYHGKSKYSEYRVNLAAIPEYEQHELIRLYLEYTDRDLSECIYGNDFSINNDFTCALLSLLQDDSQENRDRFAHATMRNLVIYFSNALQDVLDEACHDMVCSINRDNGNSSYQDKETGEFEWRKI